jgi:beta-galactosidase
VNNLIARGSRNGKRVTDATEVEYRLVTTASPEIAINVGSNADFTDETGRVWIADQPYKKGEWGFVGSAPTRVYNSPPDRNILLTKDDPLFQTFVEGIEAYRIDVPAGNYSVELLFAETKLEQAGKRVFDVSINSQMLISELDPAASPGRFRPLTKSLALRTERGIEIKFSVKAGKAILNGIRIRRS